MTAIRCHAFLFFSRKKPWGGVKKSGLSGTAGNPPYVQQNYEEIIAIPPSIPL
jgi:hypothetical protein